MGGCTHRVQTAWPCLGSSLKMTWLVLGGHFCQFWPKWSWKPAISPCRASISSIQGPFLATAGWHFSRDLARHLLIGGCDQSHISVKETRVPLRGVECENDLEKKTWNLEI